MENDKINIRRVQPDDVPAVVEHIRNVLGEFGLQFGIGSTTDDAILDLPASYDEHGGAFWIALENTGLLIGTCAVYPLSTESHELRKMYLARATRGRGVGKHLLDLAIGWSRDCGAKRLVLDTTEAMTRAIAFYERHGFVRDDNEIRGSRCTRGSSLTL